MQSTDAAIRKPDISRPNNHLLKTIVKQKSLVIMSLPILAYVFIFSYRPLKNLVMAFQDYRPGKKVQEWVGWENFGLLFNDERFLRVIRNTICMSTLNLVFSFLFAILLAILLNELRNGIYKKVVQSISYLPHFLSWIIVTGLVANFLTSDNGMINNALTQFGILKEPVPWLSEPNLFWLVVAAANVWKETGWNSIIYLAAITNISSELYEAAFMDGANRFQRIRHITLPGIKSTVVILLILNLGFILNAGFEVQFLLGNGIVSDVSETIDIFVLKNGISLGNFSLATAAGMFQTVVSVIMITGANYVAKKLGEERLV